MISSLSRAGAPLFRIASDDFNGDIIATNFDVCDCCKRIDPFYFEHVRSDGQSSLYCRLRVILHGIPFNVGIENLEWDRPGRSFLAPEEREIERSRDECHKALLAFKNGGWACHPSLRQQRSKHPVAGRVR